MIIPSLSWLRHLPALLLAASIFTAGAAEPATSSNAPVATVTTATNTVTTNAVAGTVTETRVERTEPERRVWLTFGLDRVPLLQRKPLAGIPLWQFVASLVYVFLAFYVSKLLDLFIRNRVEKWAAMTQNRLDDVVVQLVRGPVTVVSFVVFLHIGMEVYAWPPTFSRYLSAALKIVVAASITYVLLKGVEALVGVWQERAREKGNEEFGRQLLPLIGKSLKVFVVIVAVLLTSQNLGLNVTGLIASLSIGGLALGLAAQDTLANLFGAVAVLMDKPFKVGDRVQLEGVDGSVESIGFRSTRVRNLDGHLVTIPNKTMGNATITNVSLRSTIKTEMNLGVTYDTTPEKVEEALRILREVLGRHPNTHDVWVAFDQFRDSSLNLKAIYWWNNTDYKAFLGGLELMNLEIKRRFEAAGIDFAFPTQTLYVQRGDGTALEGSPGVVAGNRT